MKEVVVIGAGASGLAAIRSLLKYKDKVNITAYEVSDRVGGLWVNRDPYKTSPMYDGLQTNSYKAVCGFADSLGVEVKESYVYHSQYLQYIEDYSKKFNMHQYIQFRHRVLEVDPYKTENERERWCVTARNETNGVVRTQQFDAVVVCNGHHEKPHIPDVKGMKTYTGETMHSIYYQSPEYFKGKTVLIVGGKVSGLDILFHMKSAPKKIYFSHHNPLIASPLPDNTEHVTDISEISGDDIILNNGRVIQADIILFATGYEYYFPFLSDRCRPTVKDGHVTNIYRMMVDIDHPSLYYIGLNTVVVALYQLSFQAELAAAFISEKIPPISKEEMKKEYDDWYKRHVTDLGKRPKDCHIMPFNQHEYAAILAKESLSDFPVTSLPQQLLLRGMKMSSANYEHWRSTIYKILSNDSYETVYLHPVYSSVVNKV